MIEPCPMDVLPDMPGSEEAPEPAFRYAMPVPDEIAWYAPAIRMDSRLSDGSQVLRMLDDWRSSHPRLAHLIDYAEWLYLTRAGAATGTWERLGREARLDLNARNLANREERELVTREIAELQRRLDRMGRALARAQRRFESAAGEAGLVCDPGKVSPSEVLCALDETLPDEGALAGGAGVLPARGRGVEELRRSQERFAQLASGTLLGIPLFVTMGYLPPNFVSEPHRWLLLLPAAAAGWAVVGALGQAVEALVYTAFRSGSGSATETQSHDPRGLLRIGAVLLGMLAAGEGASQGFGAFLVNQERFSEAARWSGGSAPAAGGTLALCLLAGSLSTGAFLLFKLACAWADCQGAADNCALRRRHHQLREEGRAQGAVRLALRRSYQVARLREEHARLTSALAKLRARHVALAPQTDLDAATKTRLDAAHEAAVGETARWQDLVAALVRLMGPGRELARPLDAQAPAAPRNFNPVLAALLTLAAAGLAGYRCGWPAGIAVLAVGVVFAVSWARIAKGCNRDSKPAVPQSLLAERSSRP